MKTVALFSAAALLLLSGCETFDDAFDREREIALTEVPAAVLEAGKLAVPGFVAEEAEVENEQGRLVYELEGRAGAREIEIEILADGTVLEIETEDEDDGEPAQADPPQPDRAASAAVSGDTETAS